MKLVQAYIHHIRTADVVQALKDLGHRNLALIEVVGTLRPVSDYEDYYAGKSDAALTKEVRLELACADGEVERVTTAIRAHGRLGPQISGWIYVSPIDLVMPIGEPPDAGASPKATRR